MYLLDALGVLARRWYVVLFGLGLLAAAAHSVAKDVPTEYQASSQMLLLLPPDSTGSLTPTSPYLNAPAGLTTTASLVAGNQMTDDTERAMAKEGFGSRYSVAVLPGAGPLLVVTAKGSDPVNVVRTRDAVMSRIRSDLVAIQQTAAVPDHQLIFTSDSSVDARAEVLPGSKMRALIGVLSAGLLLLLVVVSAVDRVLILRRARRQEARAEAAMAQARAAAAAPTPPTSPHVVDSGVGR